jgi:RNA polymerase sigma-70 factor (ECF subfamily)
MRLEICSDRETPEDAYERQEQRTLITDAIKQLNEEYRSVIILRDVQGFSYEEISFMLDCSLGTIKSRINRARNVLKDKLRASMELSSKNPV